MMKTYIIRLALFIPFCIVFYCIMIGAWGVVAPEYLKQNLFTPNNNSTSIRLNEISEYSNVDILFLGSSRAYSTFDVRTYEQMGYKSFNLGTSSQTPLQTKILLERYLEDLNPKLIVYEVSPITFSSDGVESAVDIVANDKLDIASFSMLLQTRHLRVLNSLISRVFEALLQNKPATKTLNKKDRTYIKGGYVEVHQMNYTPKKRAKSIYATEYNEQQIEAFEDIIELLNDFDTKLILVQVPLVKAVYQQYDNNQFNDMMSQYSDYHDFNLNDDLNGIEYFRDNVHLNKIGVATFNNLLIDKLRLSPKVNSPN